MPKDIIDYSNTIIYKIYCKDQNICDVYVGHTTNFTKRKYHHKSCCNNSNNKFQIYEIIKKNGGWDNWDMTEIAKYNCKDITEVRIKQQEHFELLQSNLNTDKKHYCNTCKKQYSSKKDYEKHLSYNLCNFHEEIMEINGNAKNLKIKVQDFYCKQCDYKCFQESEWSLHLMTPKHKNGNFGNHGNHTNLKKNFHCNCGKYFLSNSGLWKHRKNCNENALSKLEMNEINEKEVTDKELIMMLLKQNAELITQNAELCKNGTHNTTISHNNSHNKTFNLQFFLNETCKDAMNIMDFVDSIKLQLSDLETVGKLGYIEGISNIINTNLKALDISQRPVHCTDKKREVLYIKDENKWEKENESKSKIRKAIKHVAHKNSKLIPAFREKYPDCGKSISKYSDQFNKIVIEAMGGAGDNDIEKENKIISNISKNVIVDKEN